MSETKNSPEKVEPMRQGAALSGHAKPQGGSLKVELPKAREVDLYDMKAVYGLLIHPYTQTRFNRDKAIGHELDGWCKTQIEAGKLAVV